jgi:hypothetical protein
MKHDLSTRIAEILAGSFSNDKDETEYQDTFANEGVRKAEYVIDDLRYRASEGEFQLERLAYLCIGGADGSEVAQVLDATAISKAVMIEISDVAVKKARARAEDLEKRGKEFVVLEGDATARLNDALSVAEAWCRQGEVDGLVCSAQGVLHELPSRSKQFDLANFLGAIFKYSGWKICAFYSREPSLPDGWPPNVRIRVPGLDGGHLARMARHVAARCHIQGEATELASDWVALPSVLAVETLHKLIRAGSVQRIEYELGEQLTSFDPMAVQAHLESMVDGMKVSVEYITTLGFKRAMLDYGVEYRGHDSRKLSLPRTHSEVIGFVCKAPLALNRVVPAATGAPGVGAKFSVPNPFGGAVENAEIQQWLEQFQAEDRPLMARLVGGFTYITFSRAREMMVGLYQQLEQRLGGAFERAWYVPVGAAAKSGGLVAYQFRTLNRIPANRFLSYADIEKHVADGDPIVLLDDLLATGHQTIAEWNALRNKTRLPEGSPMLWATLVSCEAGRTHIAERTPLESISVLALSREDEPMGARSALFPDAAERDRVRTIVERYGAMLAPTTPLGYGGLGLLLAFEHSTPDNSPPIFWGSTNGWRPLLEKGTPPRPQLG